MASLAQIGWWEVDLTAGYYLCSDYLSDLLGLDGDTIRFVQEKPFFCIARCLFAYFVSLKIIG